MSVEFAPAPRDETDAITARLQRSDDATIGGIAALQTAIAHMTWTLSRLEREDAERLAKPLARYHLALADQIETIHRLYGRRVSIPLMRVDGSLME